MTETPAEFSKRMETVEKDWEYVVGMAHQGHTRAKFDFDGMLCFLESGNYRRMSPKGASVMARAALLLAHVPYDFWWTDYAIQGRAAAKAVADRYNAKLHQNPYEETWFSLRFDEFDDLMKFCYDRDRKSTRLNSSH